MIYSFWDIECVRLKLVIISDFLSFYTILKTWKIIILEKWKKLLAISSFYICVPKTTIIWCMLPEKWSATDTNFCHFGPFFAVLPHNWPRNLKFEKNVQKDLEILSFYTCVNEDHVMYGSSDIRHKKQSFWSF